MMITIIQARRQAELDQRDERSGHQQLVGDRIEQRAEPRHLVVAAREVAVEEVGDRGDEKDGQAEVLVAENFVSSTTTRNGTRKMRNSVSEFGRFQISRRDVFRRRERRSGFARSSSEGGFGGGCMEAVGLRTSE